MIEKREPSDQLPKAVAKDGAKWLLIPSKIVLKSFCNWPENRTLLVKFLSQLATFGFFISILGNIYLIMQNANNLDDVVYSISMLVISAETMGRRILIEVYAKTFRKLLLHVYDDFWASDVAGEDTHCEIKKKTKLLLNFFIGFSVIGVTSVMQTIISANVRGAKPLFTLYTYPFETSPYFECMFIMEAYLTFDVIFATNSTDIFLYSLLYNCEAQFKLLSAYFKVNFDKILHIPDDEERGRRAIELIVKCVKHHELLLQKLLLHIYDDFWASDIAGEDTHREIKEKSKLLLNFFIGVAVISVTSVMQTIISANVRGAKPLFTLYTYPFETSPYFECMFIVEAYLTFDVVFATSSTDIFLYTLLFNCEAQFKVLSAYFKANFEKILHVADAEERGRRAIELIVKCVKHHELLLQ
ncbi:hypothetical protein RN001_015390 [Aquatica leii]|uniref:Odorant receptor n=1 Tax=Aquatica leii TaxID=1421715 RepID=A0AAN7S6M2_9COLE|nr:hypothetical protein RN001_015390 [Aquatica leii]